MRQGGSVTKSLEGDLLCILKDEGDEPALLGFVDFTLSWSRAGVANTTQHEASVVFITLSPLIRVLSGPLCRPYAILRGREAGRDGDREGGEGRNRARNERE